MGHSYNNGLHTTSKGITIDAIRVMGLNTTPCTIVEDCKSGLISGVTKPSTGTYVFQLTAPYPPKLVICQPTVSGASPTADIIHPQYKDASYNATTGQFTIELMNDDDVTVPVAVDGLVTTELHVLMMFNRYTR